MRHSIRLVRLNQKMLFYLKIVSWSINWLIRSSNGEHPPFRVPAKMTCPFIAVCTSYILASATQLTSITLLFSAQQNNAEGLTEYSCNYKATSSVGDPIYGVTMDTKILEAIQGNSNSRVKLALKLLDKMFSAEVLSRSTVAGNPNWKVLWMNRRCWPLKVSL